jgi:alpha-mannosidase
LDKLGFKDKDNIDDELVALNTLPWNRTELVKLPIKSERPKYAIASGATGAMIVTELTAATESPASITEVSKGVFQLTNPKFKILVEDGVITSLFDKEANREVLSKGEKANQFVIFDDKPIYWQAWDVEVYHLESRKELKSGKSYAVETGPHRVSVTTETKISKDSWIKSTISLDALVDDANSQIVIETEVEWRENMKFLKVEFPVDITNTEASYESQYGMIKRPTHYNTSWDAAKFEVCCHKWADLSEAGYGVSILNDSKYGFATIGKLMRLSLLRAPKAPDAHADMGRHHIRYAILPHSGPLDHRTVRAGYNFNNPLQLHRHSSPSSIASVMAAIRIEGPPGLIVDCIKRGEDDEDIAVGLFPPRKGRSIIVRVFDSLGGKTNAKLVWGSIPVKKANITNVLEDDGEELKLSADGTSTNISLRAFEVLTIRLQL